MFSSFRLVLRAYDKDGTDEKVVQYADCIGAQEAEILEEYLDHMAGGNEQDAEI